MSKCRCADAGHRAGCPMALIESRRGDLYEGMYDAPVPAAPHFVLLNPACAADDATSRRFALLEIE